MYDRGLEKEILSQILKALDIVISRFAPIKSLSDSKYVRIRFSRLGIPSN